MSRPHCRDRVQVVEVGPRDGLQNEARESPTADKIAFVDALERRRAAGRRGHGVREPEVGAADGRRARMCRRASRDSAGTRYTALVPNLAGLERALERGTSTRVAIFAAASETFSRRNINRSIDESLDALRRGVRRARAWPACACAATSRRRSAVRTKAPCRSRGWSSRRAAARTRRIRSGGQRHDRRRASRPGLATCSTRVLARVPADRVALHFHDTRGTALANVLAALEPGIATFDARPAAWAAVPTRPARRAISRPKTSCTCWTGWASRPASRSTRSRRRRWRWASCSGTGCRRGMCRRCGADLMAGRGERHTSESPRLLSPRTKTNLAVETRQ